MPTGEYTDPLGHCRLCANTESLGQTATVRSYVSSLSNMGHWAQYLQACINSGGPVYNYSLSYESTHVTAADAARGQAAGTEQSLIAR